MTAGSFDDAWMLARDVEGWLTEGQARRLWQETSATQPLRRVVEIGSHHGKSTIVLATAADAVGARVTAIDPFDNPRWGGGPDARVQIEKNLAAAGVQDTVDLTADLSTSVRPTWTEQVDVLYIDGAHDYPTVVDDLKWAEHVREGGVVAIHDAFSSIGVTRALLQHVTGAPHLAYAGRERSLVILRRRRPSAFARLRLVAQTGWFLRNVLVKVALRRRWAGLARALGHEGADYPY